MVVENAKSEKKNEKSSTNRSIYVKNRMCCGIKKKLLPDIQNKIYSERKCESFSVKMNFFVLVADVVIVGWL